MHIHVKFGSRRAGSFGMSAPGRVAEWITTTWLRFTCALFTVAIVAIVSLSDISLRQKMLLDVTAPIGALFAWFALLFCLLVCRNLGLFGKILANALVIYFYVFSNLIVQRPPTVALRLTR